MCQRPMVRYACRGGRARRVGVLMALGLALTLAACGGGSAAARTPPPSPPASSTEPPVAGSFADLPFTLDLPSGWVFGTQQQVDAHLRSLTRSDTGQATRYQALLARSPTLTSEFIAYDIGSSESFTESISCNTVDRGSTSAADALDLGETQNADAIAGLPGIVGKPTVDRVTLPIGETVRIRWRTKAPVADTTSIGYLFVAGPIVYTCVFTADTATVASHQPEWESILGTFHAKTTAAASASTQSTTASGCPAVASLPHQAPDIEGLLPGIVQGRALSRWSVRGECWLEQVISDPSARQQVVSAATTAANPDPVDPAQLVYGVAGRSNTKNDPPYFVFAAVRPQQSEEIDLAMYLLFGGAGFKDIAAGIDLRNYQERTIGGKQVYVGTSAMIDQGEHQRGRPYLYQTDTHMFLVISDSDAWAEDAIAQLP